MPSLECPDRETLSRLLIGVLPNEAAESHQRHLERCAACVETVEQLAAEDTLTLSLAGGPLTAPAEIDDAEELIGKIQQLPFAGGGSADSLDIDVAQFLHPPQEDDELGRLGEHRVLQCLGSGGMGIVFKAEDTRLQRMVALKVMHPVLAASRNAGKRFLREARAAAAFEHEHVVTIYNVGEDRGLPWLSMELLEGESLETRLRSEATLPVHETLRIGREIAAGLAAAHRRGLLHRDVKPDNIWLESGGDRVTIVDFGLARVSEGDSLVTREGAILGTPEYMSPEQARGEAVDARSDLFSFGCVLYRMTTGVSPFARGNLMGTLQAVSLETVAAPAELSADVPPALSDLIVRLLAKSPDERPASAEEVGEVLRAIADGDVILRPVASSRRQTWWPLLVAMLLLGGVLGFAAATVIQWTTDKGTLVVEAADDQIAVSVADGTLHLRDRDSGEEIALKVGKNRLPSGEYELLLQNKGSELALSLKEFALVRGGKQRVWVYWKPVEKPVKAGDGQRASPAAIGAAAPPSPSAPPKWLPQNEGLSLPKPGEPLSPQALVQSPAPLPGVAAWSVETRDHRASVRAATLSPDGAMLATAGYDGAIRLWNLPENSLKQVLLGYAAWPSALAISPDGRFLAAVGNESADAPNHVLRIWQLGETVSLVRRRELPRNTNRLAWSPPEGKLIALQDRDDEPPTIYSWRDDKMLSNFGISGAISQRPWSHDGRLLATADAQGVHLWDVEASKAVHTIPGESLSDAQWSGDGPYLAVLRRFQLSTTVDPDSPRVSIVNYHWKLEIWNTGELQLAKTLDLGEQELRDVPDFVRSFSYLWSPGGGHLAVWRRAYLASQRSGWMGQKTQLWNVKSGESRELPQLSDNNARESYYYLPTPGHQGFAWSADGTKLATVFRGRAWLTDIESGDSRAVTGFNALLALQRTSLAQNELAVHQSSPGVAGSLTMLNLERFETRSIGNWKAEDNWRCSLSPDGETVVTLRVAGASETIRNTGQTQGEIAFWNVASGAQVGENKLDSVSVINPQLVWSPSGDRLALVDGTVRILDARDGRLLRTLKEGKGQIRLPRPVAWSPDGRWMLTYDGTSIVVNDLAMDDAPVHRLSAPIPEGLSEDSRRRAFPTWQALAFAWSDDGNRIAAVNYGRFLSNRTEGPSRFAGDSTLRMALHVWRRHAGDFQLIHTTGEAVPRQLFGEQHERHKTAVSFSSSGRVVALSRVKLLKLIDLEAADGADAMRQLPVELADEIDSLRWLGDDRLLLTAGDSPAGEYADEYALIDTITGETVSQHRVRAIASVAVDEQSAALVAGAELDLFALAGPRQATLFEAAGGGERAWVAVDPRGYFKSFGSAEPQLVFAVLMTDGTQLTLSPEEFAERFGWKNVPDQVRLVPETQRN